MSTYRTQLQAFLGQVRKWEDRLKRSTYSSHIVFSVEPTGEFSITALWQTRSGAKGQHVKRFSLDYLFGQSLSSASPKIQKHVCFCMREFMQEVLHARGV